MLETSFLKTGNFECRLNQLVISMLTTYEAILESFSTVCDILQKFAEPKYSSCREYL